MSATEDAVRQSKLWNLARALLNLPKRITEPSKLITDEGDRRKARFLSVAIFTGIVVFPILQITSDVTMGIPYYSGSAILLAAFYILSRTEHVRLTSALSIIFMALFPFMILLLNPVWPLQYLAFQIFPWPVIAVLIGSQLLSKAKEAILIIAINIGLIVVSLVHPGMIFQLPMTYSH